MRRIDRLPLDVARRFGGRGTAPATKPFDCEKDASQQHENIGENQHHRVDRNRLFGHDCDALSEGGLRFEGFGDLGLR